jgi:L-asparaginase
MIPLNQSRSDAVANIKGALFLSANFVISEVLVFFNNSLMRGNRVTQIANDRMAAFSSPNFEAIGNLDVKLNIKWGAILAHPEKHEAFKIANLLESKIGFFLVTPFIHYEALA